MLIVVIRSDRFTSDFFFNGQGSGYVAYAGPKLPGSRYPSIS